MRIDLTANRGSGVGRLRDKDNSGVAILLSFSEPEKGLDSSGKGCAGIAGMREDVGSLGGKGANPNRKAEKNLRGGLGLYFL